MRALLTGSSSILHSTMRLLAFKKRPRAGAAHVLNLTLWQKQDALKSTPTGRGSSRKPREKASTPHTVCRHKAAHPFLATCAGKMGSSFPDGCHSSTATQKYRINQGWPICCNSAAWLAPHAVKGRSLPCTRGADTASLHRSRARKLGRSGKYSDGPAGIAAGRPCAWA